MYAGIWRLLPGPWPARLLVLLTLLALLVFVLFTWVFPWAEEALDISNVTVG